MSRSDMDADGVMGECGGWPIDPAKTERGIGDCGKPDVDSDGDGRLDCLDNCPNDPNPDQADENGNGVGDVCTPPPPTDAGAAH